MMLRFLPMLTCITMAMLSSAEEQAKSEKLIAAVETTNRIANSDRYWAPQCPAGFYRSWSAQNIASVCFRVNNFKKNWYDARSECSRQAAQRDRCHGDLASVLNDGEKQFVQTLMSSLDDHAWIGFNDIGSYNEGYFSWADGRTDTFRNFYSGEPNNGGGTGDEDCVEMMTAYYGGRWNDRNCDDLKYFVCKAYCV